MTAEEVLESAVKQFWLGEHGEMSKDVIQSTVTATVSVSERLVDREAYEVASFHLDRPLISWTVRLEAGAGDTLRLVLGEMTAADMGCLRVHGVLRVLQRPAGQASSGEDDAEDADGENSDASTGAVQGSSGSSPSYCSASPGPSRGPRARPPLQPASTPLVVLTDRPTTIASFHRDTVAQMKLTMTTFYYHPAPRGGDGAGGGHGQQHPADGGDHDDLRLGRLSADLGRLRASQAAADVSLVVEGQLVLAHRAVLAARSDVLRRMLEEAEAAEAAMPEPGPTEPGTGPAAATDGTLLLDLPDATLEAVSKVLDFVYAADVRGLPGCETGVLVLASRLGLADLADECCRRLLRALDVDGGRVAGMALELLAFAEQHGVRALKERALLVAAHHLREVTASAEWREYRQRLPSLAADLLETAAGVLEKP